MTNYSVSGTVSDQVAEGQTVTIDVTAPDGTKVPQQTALTLADLTYSDSWSDAEVIQVGTYTVAAHGDADAKFTAWDATGIDVVAPAPVTRTGTVALTVTA